MSEREPCGNESCDKCYPHPTWKIGQHRIQHITYERLIKAATLAEAMVVFEQGTAWPSSYDDRGGEVIQEDDAVGVQLPPDEYGQQCCYHDLKDRVAKTRSE